MTASSSLAHVGDTVTLTATTPATSAQSYVTFNDASGGLATSGLNAGTSVYIVNGVATLIARANPTPIPFTPTLGIGTHTLTAHAVFTPPPVTSDSAPLTLLVAYPNAVCGLTSAVATFTPGSAPPPSGATYTTMQQNQNAVCVSGTSITLQNATLVGSSGVTTYGDPAGVGAALLAYSSPTSPQNSVVTMNGGSIASYVGEQTPVVASGPGAEVNLSGTTISGSGGANSLGNVSYYGIDAGAYSGGEMALTDVTASSSDLASLLRIADGSSITVTRGTMNVQRGGFADLRGRASLSCTDVALGGSGISISQGLASTQPATLSISGGTMSYVVGAASPVISISDASANVTLTNVTLHPQSSSTPISNPIFLALLTDQYATFNPVLNLTAISQQFSGDLEAASNSALNLSLKSGSQWSGAFDKVGTIPASINVTLDANSIWSVTADSAIETLNDPAGMSATAISNIQGNGHTLTYVSAENPSLGGKTYALANGGTLQPAS